MSPILFYIGSRPVTWYGVMMALGFLSGLVNWTILGRPIGRDFKFCSDLLFWIMVAGILGARTAYVMSDLPYFLINPLEIIRVDHGGLVYFGGFLGAWLALYMFARSRQTPFFELADLVVTSLPLAHAFGRVGCFINGCCHGVPYDGWLSVTYVKGSQPFNHHARAGLLQQGEFSLAMHPVQLYEAGFNLLLFGLLLLVWRVCRRAGMVGVVYLLVYPVGRFAIEFLRGDDRICRAGLSLAQWISIGLFAVGLGLWAVLRRTASGQQETA